MICEVENGEVFLHDQLFPRKISDALSSYLCYFPQIKLQPIELNSDSSQQIEFALPFFAMNNCCDLLFTFLMVIFLNKSVHSNYSSESVNFNEVQINANASASLERENK